MTKSNSFAMLKELAEQRRDACTRRLGKALAEQSEASTRLRLLLDYRTDYQGRLERASRDGIKGEGLRNYQNFLANLERAVEQQSDIVATIEETVLRIRADLASEQRQIESYAVLLKRRANAAAEKENRRQQAMQDEFALNSVIRLERERNGGNN
jgi:flagellar protein FliJ